MFKIFKTYYLYIIFIFYFLVNIPILNNLPFPVDYELFIESTKHIKNPLYAWFPWSIYFKSWPLGYTFYWLMLEYLGENVVYFRTVNLVLHFLNFILFRKLIKKGPSGKLTELVSLLFLFHPLSILTYSWSFQLKTLISVSFLLLLMNFLKNRELAGIKDFIKLNLLFFFSITGKVVAIFFPIYFILDRIKKMPRQSFIGFTSGLLLISLFYGLINIKGVSRLAQELNFLKQTPFSEQSSQVIKTSDFIEYELPYQVGKDINFDIDVYKEVQRGAKYYTDDLGRTENLRQKQIISTQNLGRLVLYTFGLNSYFPFYESNIELIKNPLLPLFIIIGILFFALIVITRNKDLFLSLLLFLPISGYFYVPYMKFSYTSDHWFYPAYGFVLLGIFRLFKNKYFWSLSSLIILASYFSTNFKYQDFEKLFYKNYNT